MLDPTDLRILALLQANARTANAEIARALHMAPSAILERIKKLEGRGYVTGYEARLAPRQVGLGLLAFVFVRVADAQGARAGAEIAALPEVLEVHEVAGEDCFLVKLRARDTEDLARLLNQRLKTIPGLSGTRTTIVLATLKETAQVPLTQLERAEEPA
jgi:Lrp/AsnC family leucine-responsive transcriptional regulator